MSEALCNFLFYSNDKSNVGLWSSSWSLAIILLIKWCCKTNDEAAVTHLGIVAWSQSMTRFLDLEKSPEILNNSNENSRSTTRNPFFISRPLLEIRDLMEQILDLVSKLEMLKTQVSISSRTTRLKKSWSCLEKKRDHYSYFLLKSSVQ